MGLAYQVAIFADPRFSGGTSTAVASEIKALSHCGIVPAICPVLSALLRRSSRMHPAITGALREGKAFLLDADCEANVGLAVIHHPMLFQNLPPRPVRLRAETLILVLHHPPFDGFGQAQYDLDGIVDNIEESFGTDVLLAPVGPAVRAQLARCPAAAGRMLEKDWSNLIDFEAWSFRSQVPQRKLRVIGRHSRHQLAKYPDTLAEALLCYPEDGRFAVRMLGASADLVAHYGRLPANWELLSFGALPVPEFLEGLDCYVYFHGRSWVEAFGYGILEAIARGVPAILPPHFEPLFGPAALYSQPDGVAGMLNTLENDPDSGLCHAKAARAHAQARFGLDQYAHRLDAHLGGWRGALASAAGKRSKSPPNAAHVAGRAAKPARRILMMTSNGVGLGHLTRCIAIAKKLPGGTDCAFFTLSQAFGLAIDAGYLTQYVPYHGVSGADQDRWNAALAEELGDFLDFFRPHALVFDGNVPYSGIMDALRTRQQVRRVWVRRALNGPGDEKALDRGARFDLVIEPGELSGRFDCDPATEAGMAALTVAPILSVNPGDRLSAQDARRELGIPSGELTVGVMLGAANNFDLTRFRAHLLERLHSQIGAKVIEIVSPVRRSVSGAASSADATLALYPASRYSKAFDFMVTGAGYNSFHENMLGCVPTIFVPNEAPEMDLQILRAQYAQRIGCGELLRATDRIRTGPVLERMANPEARAEMCRRMARLPADQGADAAAEAILLFAAAIRTVDGF